MPTPLFDTERSQERFETRKGQTKRHNSSTLAASNVGKKKKKQENTNSFIEVWMIKLRASLKQLCDPGHLFLFHVQRVLSPSGQSKQLRIKDSRSLSDSIHPAIIVFPPSLDRSTYRPTIWSGYVPTNRTADGIDSATCASI